MKLQVMHLAFMNLLLFCFFGSYSYAERFRNETDHRALMEFKAKITGDNLGTMNLWNDTVHFCKWQGVTCGRRHQRVVMLELPATKLEGSISPHLGNLSFLKVLNLANNTFSNEIPQEIWDLGRLEQLVLSNNFIAGVIPTNISCSSKLKLLNLNRNRLSGEVTDTLGCFSHLQVLQLSTNNFTGKIPPSLGNLSSLRALDLPENSLTGALPESLGQLKNLTFFQLGDNELSGSIPWSIFNLSKLRTFSVPINQFQGSFPTELGTTMPYLETFSISNNGFTGMIPPSLSNETHLRVFSIAGNRFTGSLPSLHKLTNLWLFSISQNHMGSGGESDLSFICSTTNATSLQMMIIGKNNFGGVIPPCIGNLSRALTHLRLETNELRGEIPSAIGNLINLEWLSFYENQLSGQIPYNFRSLEKLQLLFFDTNNLSGEIPPAFGNLKVLTRLTLYNNNLHGSIPPSLGGLKNLVVLDVSGNRLGGSIPPQLFNISPFSILLKLSGNRLTGNFPSQVGSLKNMGALDVSRNILSGEIPSSLGSCESIELLDLSQNQFQGIIPSSFITLRGLRLLNLSNNDLTGEIPGFLGTFNSLEALDLSNNDLGGPVPSGGIFVNASAISLKGNEKLCGRVLSFQLPECKFPGSNNKKLSSWKVTTIIVSSLVGVALLIFVLGYYRLQRKRKGLASSELNLQLTELSYSHHSLFQATEGFSSTNLVGVGSFGAVYKGFLDGGRMLVAIKVLNLLQPGASKSFVAECNVLRNVRHRNLLKILTVCSSIDGQGNDFKALVYEFMSNGSLEECLHQASEHNDSDQNSPRILNLRQRVSIAIDVASALDYLHHRCETPIVHCDLKPSNILFDEDMTAHVGDFGLARVLTKVPEGSLQNETSSIAIRGSIGYVAPEYGMGSQISTYGDVYSYGVLLLEMFTGKRPTDETFKGGLNLHEFAKQALPEGVLGIVDPTLLCENEELADTVGNDHIRQSSRKFQMIHECLASVIGIGVACSAQLPNERTVISDVVTQLSSINDKLHGSGADATSHNSPVCS